VSPRPRNDARKVPSDPRRTFLVTMGTAPAVVTESLWALLRRDPPWVPDRIEILTTRMGAPDAIKGLMVTPGPLDTLFGTRPVPPVAVLVPVLDLEAPVVPVVRIDWTRGSAPVTTGDLDAALADVNDEASVTCMGDLILDRVRAAKANPGDQVHVSISGGRKTMSAHALFSLGLAGDLGDESSHVLLDPAFEYNRRFWHPDQGGMIHTQAVQLQHKDKPPAEWPAPTVDPKDAAHTLRLFTIPAPRFDLVPGPDAKGGPPPRLSVIQAQLALAGDWRRDPRMVLHPATNGATINGRHARLDPVDFVWLRLLAVAAAEGWTCANDNAPHEAGAVTAARVLFYKPNYGVLADLVGWVTKANDAAENAGGAAGLSAKRSAKMTMTGTRNATQAGLALHAAIEKWQGELAGSAAKGPMALGSQQAYIAVDLMDRIGSLTKLRTHLAAKFGQALASELCPKTRNTKAKSNELPTAAYRLGGARAGFLTVEGV